MTNLPTSSSGQLNLSEPSLFTDAGLPWPLPAGTTIKCIVSAAGIIDDEIWGEQAGAIDLSTAPISIEAPAEPASKFVVGSLTLNLSDIITTDANASVQITDDNYDSVEWKVSSRQETTPPVSSDARFFTDMKPVVHWLDPGWEDYTEGEEVTVRLAAEHAYDIERIVFTTNDISKSVTTRDGDGYFSHTYVQPSGQAVTTATVTPNTAGVPMVMEGNTNISDEVGDQDGLILGGIRGFVTYGGRRVDEVTVSSQAGLENALDALVDTNIPTIINIDTPGVYYLADGDSNKREIPTNGWVIIRGTVNGVQFANQYNKCDVDVGNKIVSDRIKNSYTYEFQALGFENVEFIQEGRSQLNYGINASTDDPFFKEQLISLAPDISRNESFKTKLYYKNCVFTGCVEYEPVQPKDDVREDLNGTPIIEYSETRDITIEGRVVEVGGADGLNYELKPRNEEREFDKNNSNFMSPNTPVIDDWIDSNDAKWVIGCTADKMGVGSPIRGRQKQYVFVRDIRVENVADDILTNTACCLDIHIENFNGGGDPPSPMHSDLWQAFTNLNDGRVYGNILLKNITCWMAWEDDGDAKKGAGQAIFCDGNWGGGVDGFVVMDCEIACSVGTVKLKFKPHEQTIKNMVFSDSSLLRTGELWVGPSNDDPNPPYGDVLFRNCKNGKSTDAPIYVPGNSVTSPEFDDNPLSDWRADGTPIPYWSPYNVHILGEGDEFALEQGDGIPEGSRSILLNGWDADLTVTETVIDVPDGTVVFRAPYDIPNDTFMGVAGGAKIGLDSTDRLAFTFDASSQLNAWINDFNGSTEGSDGFDGIKITDETSNLSWNFLIDNLGDNSFTVKGPGGSGSENATYARLLENQSEEGESLLDVLQNNVGPFTVESVPRSSATRERTVNREPFYINYFAATSGSRKSYGVAADSNFPENTSGRAKWLLTPADGSDLAKFENPNENGRLFYVQDQILGRALDGRTFKRVMIGNPAGFLAGENLSGGYEDNQGYFTNAAGTGMFIDVANSYTSLAVDDTIGSNTSDGLLTQYPTPFTPSGLPEDVRGDQVSSWKSAIDELKSFGVEEVFCYIGYGQSYETSEKMNIDDNLLAYATGWPRSTKEPSVYPKEEWQRQWDILSQCGFDNASFDAGTRVARIPSQDETDYVKGDVRIKTIADVVGTDNQIFELIPRDGDGGQKLSGEWDYTKNKSWGLWPVSSGIFINGERYGKENNGDNAVLELTNWNLNPNTTEVHIVIDLNDALNKSWVDSKGEDTSGNPIDGRFMVWSEFKLLVENLKSKGFVVSATAWSGNGTMDDDEAGSGETRNAGDLCDYILSSQPPT